MSDDREDLLRSVEVLRSAGDMDGALHWLLCALEQSPDDAELLDEVARTHLEAGEPWLAWQVLDTAWALEPTGELRARTAHLLARTQEKLGYTRSAIGLYREASEWDKVYELRRQLGIRDEWRDYEGPFRQD